ncbi:hypothetical protein GCM10009785_23350 [Brooklawnia cerclae]
MASGSPAGDTVVSTADPAVEDSEEGASGSSLTVPEHAVSAQQTTSATGNMIRQRTERTEHEFIPPRSRRVMTARTPLPSARLTSPCWPPGIRQ